VSTDSGESGEKRWYDDLASIGGDAVPTVAPDGPALGDRAALGERAGPGVPGGRRRDRDTWAADAGNPTWHRLAWSLVALLTVSMVLGLTCAVWLADRAFSQLDQTERTIVNLVNSAQASSQAFAVSQDSARQAYVSSQILLNRSEAQKSREQARLDRSLITLAKAQAATQRADAQLAYAEAALDEARAHQVPPTSGGDTAHPAGSQASLAGRSLAARQAAAGVAEANSQLARAFAQLADALAAARAG
jgi:hypothetical protein